jgi:hypothetical protein
VRSSFPALKEKVAPLDTRRRSSLSDAVLADLPAAARGDS